MSYVINPQQRGLTLMLEALSPISHHDPAQNTSANTITFLRRKQKVSGVLPASTPDDFTVGKLTDAFPVPASHADFFESLSVPQFLAVVAAYLFIANYNGQGLMDSTSRYTRLRDRLKISAVKSKWSMFSFWGDLCDSMQAETAYPDYAEQTMRFITMPAALAGLVLRELTDNADSVIALARTWIEAQREAPADTVLQFDGVAWSEAEDVILEVPAFSANSLRHEMLREPGSWHLLNALGLRLEDLPDSVAALFYNGGDLNSSAPNDVFKLMRQIRENYPLLGLLGGSTDGFILGSSDVTVFSWLVCRENNPATSVYGVTSTTSAFELLDYNEHTRHTTGRVNGSPMPYGAEMLVQGSTILTRIEVRPYVTQLELGALGAALTTYVNADSTIGGQSARGYGLVKPSIYAADLDLSGAIRDYEAFLAANAEMLRKGLLEGTLGTGKRVLAA